MKDYKKYFNDKLEDGSFCDGELISIANGYITEMQNIITELEKDKQYFSDSLDKQVEATLKLHKEYQELEEKLANADYQLEGRDLKIKELEKENAELKDYRLTTLAKQQTDMSKYALNLEHKLSWYDDQLTKAKDHIKKLLNCLQQDTNDPQTNYYVVQYMTEAEQFLSEVANG